MGQNHAVVTFNGLNFDPRSTLLDQPPRLRAPCGCCFPLTIKANDCSTAERGGAEDYEGGPAGPHHPQPEPTTRTRRAYEQRLWSSPAEGSAGAGAIRQSLLVLSSPAESPAPTCSASARRRILGLRAASSAGEEEEELQREEFGGGSAEPVGQAWLLPFLNCGSQAGPRGEDAHARTRRDEKRAPSKSAHSAAAATKENDPAPRGHWRRRGAATRIHSQRAALGLGGHWEFHVVRRNFSKTVLTVTVTVRVTGRDRMVTVKFTKTLTVARATSKRVARIYVVND
jgi:hypothetical protein